MIALGLSLIQLNIFVFKKLKIVETVFKKLKN